MPVINRIAGFAEEMAGWRHWLHRHPELAFDLPQTSSFVAERLREMGVDALHEGIARTGLVALVHGRAPGKTIGLRADMDALPIIEETGLDYASEAQGKMHACGHDGHTAMLLGAARYLVETRNFAGTVALIFQPAEEDGCGGEVMVQEGIMDRFDIQEVYAIHTDPTQEPGTFHIRPGPIMASVADFRIEIAGKGGHAAVPEETCDAVAASLQIGQALMTIVARNVPAAEQVVLSLTGLGAGTVTNVIPATAWMHGTVRAFNSDMHELVETRVREIAAGIGRAMEVDVEVRYAVDAPATVNTVPETAYAAAAARDVVGEGAVTTDTPAIMGSEDFSFMLEARPGAFIFLGQGEGPFCHHPEFNFNDAVAPVGASYFARLVERRLPLPDAT